MDLGTRQEKALFISLVHLNTRAGFSFIHILDILQGHRHNVYFPLWQCYNWGFGPPHPQKRPMQRTVDENALRLAGSWWQGSRQGLKIYLSLLHLSLSTTRSWTRLWLPKLDLPSWSLFNCRRLFHASNTHYKSHFWFQRCFLRQIHFCFVTSCNIFSFFGAQRCCGVWKSKT